MDPNRLILLGEIAAAYGIKGEVRIKSYTTNPVDIATYSPLTDKSGRQIFKIETLRQQKSSLIAKLSGVHDRTSAEKLRSTGLFVRRSQLPPPEAGSYYEEDLLGLNAFSKNDAYLGKVMGILNFGAGTILEIRSTPTKESLMIPFKEAFVPEIDLLEGRIMIIPPVFIEEDKDKKKG